MITIERIYEIFLQHPVISTDTRTITKDCIFFALKGGNFNGNLFAADALGKGAAYVVVDDPAVVKSEQYLPVDDVLRVLQSIASLHRTTLGNNGLRIVALTGSNGKTTTKELMARVLAKKYNVLYTEGNLNNHIGVPLTLLRLTKEHEVAVIEMGANHLGEIHNLCRIADPDFGLITNIGLAHLEGFGGEEGVFKGKTEMLSWLEKKKSGSGFAFLLEDDVRLHHFKSRLPNMSYGTSVTAEVQGTMLDSHKYVNYEWHADGVSKRDVQTQMIGSYNLPNMLGATAVGLKLGVEPAQIDEAIASYVPDNNRSQLEQRGTNTVILDCYNANPSSMTAAIENMAVTPAKNKILILGDMFELGEASAAEHQRIVDFISGRMSEVTILLVGAHFSQTKDARGFLRMNDTQAVSQWLSENPPVESLILIKGSRGMKMETIVII